MALAPSSCCYLAKGFDQVSSLVMIQLYTGFSLTFPLARVMNLSQLTIGFSDQM